MRRFMRSFIRCAQQWSMRGGVGFGALSRLGGRPWLLAVYAVAVAAVPLWGPGLSPCGDGVAAHTDGEADGDSELRGLWSRHRPSDGGDRVAFYYFHGDGHGLFRYGRVGYTNTHSFDYRARDGSVELRFRKSGQARTVAYRVVRDADTGEDWLVLDDDPRGQGQGRYVRTGPVVSPHAAPDTALASSPPTGPAPAGHMWIDTARYATGGMGFSFYQFRGAGIDGRGTGWHHRGDFDDWSTESLTYRITADRIEIRFDLRGEQHLSRFTIEGPGEARDEQRHLVMQSDPRDFWHPHRYVDAGPSFGSEVIAEPLVAAAVGGRVFPIAPRSPADPRAVPGTPSPPRPESPALRSH